MATYKVLYWQEVPTQIRAEDDDEDLTVMLDGLAGPSSCPDPVPGTWRPPRDPVADLRPPGGRPSGRLLAEGGDHDVLVLR